MNDIWVTIRDECDIDMLCTVLSYTPNRIGIELHPNNNTIFIMDEKHQCILLVGIATKELTDLQYIIELLKMYVQGYYNGVRKGEEKIKNEFKRLLDIVIEQ